MTHPPERDGAVAVTPTVPFAPLARWEGAAFMATGVALVAHILVDVPLWLSVLVSVGAAAAVIAIAARRHASALDDDGRKVIAVGFIAAVAATACYDLSRIVVVEVLGFGVSPFGAFPHFGAGLLGEGASETARWVAGTVYHYVNGITFGIAYTVLAGRRRTLARGVLTGTAFGLGLEAIMLGLYPAWLQIPNMREFASMSVLGHVVYGATVGYVAHRALVHLEDRAAAPDRTAVSERTTTAATTEPKG